MNIAADIKRAPRWAVVSVAGLTAGAVAIKLYKGRAADAATQTATDSAPAGDSGGTTMPTTNGPGGVIIPPVVTTTQNSDSGVGDAFQFLSGAFTDLSGLVGQVVTGDQQNIATLVGANTSMGQGALDALAAAGSAPQPVAVAPTPIIVQVPVAAPAPAPGPPVAQGPQCPGAFPYHNPSHGGPSGGCYKCEHNTDSDKRQYPWVHRYRDGTGVKTAACPS